MILITRENYPEIYGDPRRGEFTELLEYFQDMKFEEMEITEFTPGEWLIASITT